MKNYLIKILNIVGILFISFFIDKTNAKAVEKCVWHTYEPGIYYDSSSKTYKPVQFDVGHPMSYTLTFDASKKKSFSFSGSGNEFKKDNNNFKDNLMKLSKCPEYISVSYTRNWSNGYRVILSNQSEYKNYIKSVYGKNFSLFSSGNEAYGAVVYSGFLDSKFNMEENDDNSKSSTPIYYTSKESKYPTDLKFSAYCQAKYKSASDISECEKEGVDFQKKLRGLQDKGKKVHYKEDFYNSTVDRWASAINTIKKELKTNCSNYQPETKTKNREAYLDLIDYDLFPKMLESPTISSYQDSIYKDKIPGEKCYNTVVKAMYMQEAFSKWFSLVDWLMLTKIDQENGDIDQFYNFYEFAYLSEKTDSTDNVRDVYDALKSWKNFNTANKDDENLSKDICSALCYNQNPAYKSTASSNSYIQCMNSEGVRTCKNAEKECKKKCANVLGTSNTDCFNTCMKEKLGDDAYKTLTENTEHMREDNDNKRDNALEGLKEALSRIDAPEFTGIKFDQNYVPDCKDYEVFHNIYNILRVIAPILVILFGTLDYAKAVIASDVEKMEKSKKQFPKRLILLVLFIMVPFIISFLINSFSFTNTTIASCVVNGK